MAIEDINLIAKVIRDKAYDKARQYGIRSEHIEGVEKRVWDFIENYAIEYKSVPDIDTIEQKFEINLPAPNDPIEYIAQQILDRSLNDELNTVADSVAKSMNVGRPREAFKALKEFVYERERSIGGTVNLVNIFKLTDRIKNRYYDAKEGRMGIKTPWDRMNEMTMGWLPGDVSFFVGRTGTGKTWISLLLAKKAWEENKKILFVSGEMTADDIAGRYFSIQTQTHYGAFRRGKLSDYSEGIFFQKLSEMGDKAGIEIVESKRAVTSDDVNTAVAMAKPDLLIVDSCYRIKASGKPRDRFENMAMMVDDMKTVAQNHSVPIICTTQLNRDSTKKKKPGLEDVAMSDVIGWNATNVFNLAQTDEERRDFKMGITALKLREGPIGEKIVIKWDMISMDFRDINEIRMASNDVDGDKEEDLATLF